MTAQPIEKQPQEIRSADNTLQTLHHRMAVNRFGHRVIEGAVRNIGPDSGVDAELTVEYYSADGRLIGTEVDFVRRLGPGKTGAFEVVYSGDERWNIKHYRIVALKSA